MSAHTLTSTDVVTNGDIKTAVITVTGSASYDAGGSTLDLSSIFPSKVWGLSLIGVAAHGSAKYHAAYVLAASRAPATGKVKIHDVTASSGAEVSGDLSSVQFTFLATGA